MKKNLIRAFSAGIAFLMLMPGASFAGTAGVGDLSLGSTGDVNINIDIEHPVGASLEEVIPVSGVAAEDGTMCGNGLGLLGSTDEYSKDFYGDQLNEMSKLIYDSFCDLTFTDEQLEAGSAVIDIAPEGYGYTTESASYQWKLDVNDAFYAFIFDHPEKEIFSLETKKLIGQNRLQLGVSIMKNAEKRQEKLRDAVDDLTAGLDVYSDDLERFRALHDRLCRIASYNYEYIEDESAYMEEHPDALPHRAFSALADDDHLPVCDGYAKAFKVLCDAADLPCIVVPGEDTSEDDAFAHAWNYICICGSWYAVDLTWDDLEFYDSQDDYTYYSLFYQYFTDDSYFEDGSRTEHKAFARMPYGLRFSDGTRVYGYTYKLPKLADGRADGTADYKVEYMEIVSDLSNGTIPEILKSALGMSSTEYEIGDTDNKWDITSYVNEVVIDVSADSTLVEELSVPEGKSLTIRSTCGETCNLTGSGQLADVRSGGTLQLDDINVESPASKAAGSATIATENGAVLKLNGESGFDSWMIYGEADPVKYAFGSGETPMNRFAAMYEDGRYTGLAACDAEDHMTDDTAPITMKTWISGFAKDTTQVKLFMTDKNTQASAAPVTALIVDKGIG